jgi:phosphatidylglycerol---prolipoprotein diacylglyceryl transferase
VESVGSLISAVGWPVLDRVHIFGDFAISPHGVGIAVGFLVGSWWVIRDGPKRDVSDVHLSSMLFWALVGAVFGSRFFYVLGHFSEFDGLGDMLAIWRGGISLIGGIAGAIMFAYPLIRKHRYRFLQVMDCTALAFPLGIAVGRIGDLVIGDHLGKPTSWLLAWTYEGGNLAPPYACVPEADPTMCTASLFGGKFEEVSRSGARLFDEAGNVIGQGVGVHQTAMYDLLWCAVLFAFLLWFARRATRREGVMVLTFAILYGSMRVVTDFLRVDKTFFGLTGSQWTTGTVALASIGTLVYWAIRRPPDPARRAHRSRLDDETPTTVFTPPPEPGSVRRGR